MRYRSRPMDIEAIQWTGTADSAIALGLFAGAKIAIDLGVPESYCRLLAGKDGAQEFVPVPVGHWIVRKPDDESDYWPVDPQHFADKYELVEWSRVRATWVSPGGHIEESP